MPVRCSAKGEGLSLLLSGGRETGNVKVGWSKAGLEEVVEEWEGKDGKWCFTYYVQADMGASKHSWALEAGKSSDTLGHPCDVTMGDPARLPGNPGF